MSNFSSCWTVRAIAAMGGWEAGEVGLSIRPFGAHDEQRLAVSVMLGGIAVQVYLAREAAEALVATITELLPLTDS